MATCRARHPARGDLFHGLLVAAAHIPAAVKAPITLDRLSVDGCPETPVRGRPPNKAIVPRHGTGVSRWLPPTRIVSVTTTSMAIDTLRYWLPTWTRRQIGERRNDCGHGNSSSTGSPKENDFLTSVAGAAMPPCHSDSIWVPRVERSGLTQAPPCWMWRVDEAARCRVPSGSRSATHVRSPRPTSPSMWSARSAPCSGCPNLQASLQNSFACCVPEGGSHSSIPTGRRCTSTSATPRSRAWFVMGCASIEAVRPTSGGDSPNSQPARLCGDDGND